MSMEQTEKEKKGNQTQTGQGRSQSNIDQMQHAYIQDLSDFKRICESRERCLFETCWKEGKSVLNLHSRLRKRGRQNLISFGANDSPR